MSQEKRDICKNAASQWLSMNSELPHFSRCGTMVFNDNQAADDIEEFIVDAAAKYDIYLEPIDVVNAFFDATNSENK